MDESDDMDRWAPITVEASSPLGLFLRRCIVCFDSLPFEATCRLFLELETYRQAFLDQEGREWEEMEDAIAKFKDAGVDWPVWVMPTGAREEEQTTGAGEVAEKAFKRGYNVAARVHVYLFGNAIGT